MTDSQPAMNKVRRWVTFAAAVVMTLDAIIGMASGESHWGRLFLVSGLAWEIFAATYNDE